MNSNVFDKDTILDLTVNIIPLVILAFFAVVYFVVAPWGMDQILVAVIAHAILLFTFLSLAVLTYVAATYIERDETGLEE
ncbi:DUF6684 family protein [Halobacterium zhouii]|uniref:DUF6684 family protein n=1 Tax=Halobacterium zhouii TaxID=2902624 RepID=UPI001E630143|nr:DUF6684 family protein [Halobacterium zhouii]